MKYGTLGIAATIIAVAAAGAFAQCESRWIYRANDGDPGFDATAFACTAWDPDGAGPLAEIIVAGGFFGAAGPIPASGIAAWDGVTWVSLGSGISGGSVSALTAFEGRLVAAGSFTSAGGTPVGRIAAWDGASWQALAGGMNDDVSALTVFNGKLIAGGDFHTAGGNPASFLAQWDGSSWTAIPGGADAPIGALAVHQGRLVVGGDVNAATPPVAAVRAWDGTAWETIGAMNNTVRELGEFNGDLVAAGSFTSADQTSVVSIARRVGSTWESIGSGVNSTIYSLAVTSGDLVVGTQTGVRRWDGTSWTITQMGGIVYDLVASGTDLFAAGNFLLNGGVARNFARWDGVAWGAVGPWVSNFSAPVRSFSTFNGELVVGGQFVYAQGQTVNCVARWTGSEWAPFGAGLGGSASALAVFNG